MAVSWRPFVVVSAVMVFIGLERLLNLSLLPRTADGAATTRLVFVVLFIIAGIVSGIAALRSAIRPVAAPVAAAMPRPLGDLLATMVTIFLRAHPGHSYCLACVAVGLGLTQDEVRRAAADVAGMTRTRSTCYACGQLADVLAIPEGKNAWRWRR